MDFYQKWTIVAIACMTSAGLSFVMGWTYVGLILMCCFFIAVAVLNLD